MNPDPSAVANMEPVRIGSLFAGYGGLDMAVEQVFPGAAPAWFCEWDDAPSKVLSHHWPDVPNHRDVTTVDWATVGSVDILTGGYPCQPFSASGLRKGTDDERHLWPYVREAIRVLRPRYVVLENVAGHRSLGFDRVLGDMAEDGLDVRWTSVRASDVGAPHHRERLFILATFPDSEGSRRDHGEAAHIGSTDREVDSSGDDRDAAADTAGIGLEAGQQSEPGSAEVSGTDVGRRSLPDSDRVGRDGRRSAPVEAGWADTATDRHSVGVEWGDYAPAVRRWEQLTRQAPAPTEPNTKGKPRLNAAFAEWMMGLPEGHVTGVDIPRAAQLKAIGNGVCPQQAAVAIRQLLDIRNSDLNSSWKVAA